MAETSKIEWTDATWNPITGCSVVSPGCQHCYAMKLAGTRMRHHHSREGLTIDTKAGPVWTGAVRLNEQWLDQPLRWRRPRMIFVCAHGDLFHEKVPDEWIDQVFAVMALAPQHTFQVLTKRAERMRGYMAAVGGGDTERWATALRAVSGRCGALDLGEALEFLSRRGPLRNVWLGVSAEDQQRADERIPHLLETPAAVRWLSAEPLLGAVDLRSITVDGDGEMNALQPHRWEAEVEKWRGSTDNWEEEFLDWFNLADLPSAGPMHPRLDWVVAGGESGPGARPTHPDWARSLRDQCAAAGVPFFWKQWGEWIGGGPGRVAFSDCRELHAWGKGYYSGRVGKKAAGRLLDGVQHDAMPEVR